MKKRLMVSAGLYLPSMRHGHAGGVYYSRHVDALSEDFDIEVFSDDNAANRKVAEDGHALGVIVERSNWSKNPFGRVVQKLARELIPVSTDLGFTTALARDDRFKWAVKESAIVEIHWVELFAIAPAVRRINPSAQIVGVVHDVVSQRVERELNKRSPRLAFLSRAKIALYKAREARLYRGADRLVVFSEKDQRLVEALEPGTPCQVIFPEIPAYSTKVDGDLPAADQPVVLFEGALDRRENEDAVLFLVDEIWPQVLRKLPYAKLRVAGSGASSALQGHVGAVKNCEMTGWLDSISTAYEGASVAVVPLRLGAGVKFKSVAALMTGLPLVSTTCGAEGIPIVDGFWCISDSPDELAAGIVTAIVDADRSQLLAKDAARRADEIYGHKSFMVKLQQAYTSAADASGASS